MPTPSPRHHLRRRPRVLLVAAASAALLVLGVCLPSTALAADPPVAEGQTYDVAPDAGALLTLSARTGSVEGPLSFAVDAAPRHGSLGPLPSPTCEAGTCTVEVTYTPVTGFRGADSFTFTASDGTSVSAPATVGVEVQSGPNDPVAHAVTQQVWGGDAAEITLTGSSESSGSLRLALAEDPAHGVLGPLGAPSCDAEGTCTARLTYTPDAGYTGSDAFTYTASDAVVTSRPAQVSLRVLPPRCGGLVETATVRVGLGCAGALTTDDAEHGVQGLVHRSTGHDGVATGDRYEGWGVADLTSQTSGWSNSFTGDSPGLEVLGSETTGTGADAGFVTTVDAGNGLVVTQDAHPSAESTDLVELAVTVTNTRTETADVQYRRTMDWDGDAGRNEEYVVVDAGSAPRVAFTSDDGFAPSDPLAGPSNRGSTGSFDTGPADSGALFDLALGTLASGESTGFVLYYGATSSEAAARTALEDVGAEAWSLGMSVDAGSTRGSTDTFVFGLRDPEGLSPTAPHAVDDALTVTRDTDSAGLDVLANDTDPDDGTAGLSVRSTTAPAHGTASCTSAGQCTYTRDGSRWSGEDAFAYVVSDGTYRDTGRVVVTVEKPPNAAPVAVDDTATAETGVATAIAVLDNDRDADGDALTVSTATQPGHGTVTCETRTCTYTATGGWTGADSFTYTVTDGEATDSARVDVTVLSGNRAPTARDDTASTDEDVAVVVAVLDGDTDPDGDTLTVVGRTDGARGTVRCGTTTCTYTPTADRHGADSFTYTVSDGRGATATGTVAVSVRPVADAPVARPESAATTEDTAKEVAVTGNDTDADGDVLSAQVAAQPAHGTAACAAGSCTYTPAADWSGTDSFTYRASDGALGSAPATVTVTVSPVNDAPIARDDAFTVRAGQATALAVRTNDTDPDGDVVVVTESAAPAPAHGTVGPCGPQTCTYTAASGTTATTDTFGYAVSDGHGGTDTAIVTVSIEPLGANRAPVAADDSWSVEEDVSSALNVLGNDTDPDGDALVVVGEQSAAHGTVDCGPQACFYRPPSNWSGTASFDYEVSDGRGGTDTATVTLTVTPVGDSPGRVTGVRATPGSTRDRASTVGLRWGAVRAPDAKVSSYQVQVKRYRGARVVSTTVLTLKAKLTSTSLRLKPGSYSFAVRARNTFGAGAWSTASKKVTAR